MNSIYSIYEGKMVIGKSIEEPNNFCVLISICSDITYFINPSFIINWKLNDFCGKLKFFELQSEDVYLYNDVDQYCDRLNLSYFFISFPNASKI